MRNWQNAGRALGSKSDWRQTIFDIDSHPCTCAPNATPIVAQTRWPDIQFLCVCSDKSVQADVAKFRQIDLDFPVKTDPGEVARFLATNRQTDTVRLVFATYQSAHVVAEGIGPGESFEFAFLDEAHKTTGRTESYYGFALSSERLPVSKRLFMTATPRHVNVDKRDREGDHKVVYSMDDESVYGRLIPSLTFRDAVENGCICDYRVLVSVFTSETINAEILQRGEVCIEGDAIRAKQVANQLAIRDAVNRFGIRKAFTFHKTVASAKSFVSDGPRASLHISLSSSPYT